jgi:hypothetical protein
LRPRHELGIDRELVSEQRAAEAVALEREQGCGLRLAQEQPQFGAQP